VNYCFNGIKIFARSFPDNKSLREKWIQAVCDGGKYTGWVPDKFTKICSKHFCHVTELIKKKKKVTIAEGAVPNIPKTSKKSVS
jgi:THAP domain